MQWQAQSIILSIKQFGENLRIVTVFNREIGKVSGLLKSSKTVVQPGDLSEVQWKGKTADQLGTLKIENIFSPFSYVFSSPTEILAIDSACTLCGNGLPEKAPHEKLFDSLKLLMFNIVKKNWFADYVFFEKIFLSEIGMGLDLSKCAVTGKKENLFYVSPRTGKAVIKEVGEKYKDKLFVLPEFLLKDFMLPSNDDILSALNITGHFLEMFFHGINGRKLPLSRDYLIQNLLGDEKYENKHNNQSGRKTCSNHS